MKTIEELERALSDAKQERRLYYNLEQALKIMLNSIYGCSGSPFFYFFNRDIAESVTLQGQEAIKFAGNTFNRYFREKYHLDSKLHEALGVTVEGQVMNPVWIYTDTDSSYVSFQEVAAITRDFSGDGVELVQKIYEFRLSGLIDRAMSAFANKRNAENLLDFELELIAYRAIWIAGKNYIMDVAWQEGIEFERHAKIKDIGFETRQGQTPTFCRRQLKVLIKEIFQAEEFKVSHMAKRLSEIKRQFVVASIDEISENFRVNHYEERVLDDVNRLEWTKGTSYIIKAAARYNYALNNSVYKDKYRLIQSGDKIRMYVSVDGNLYAYHPGQFPREFAPRVDYETQFFKTLVKPVNRIIKAAGHQKLNESLLYTEPLF